MKLHDIFKKFDIEGKRFDEYDYVSACNNCDEQTKQTFEYLAEVFAFSLQEDYQSDCDIFQGKFYYGPYASFSNREADETDELPDRRSITPKMISYWEQRAFQAKNIIMICRYTGLVWEFKKYVTKTECDISVARKYLESLIAIANNDIKTFPHMNKEAAMRAIRLSHKLKQTDLLNEAKQSLEGMLARRGPENSRYILTAMYQLGKECKGAYSDKERKGIIAGLEAIFEKMSQDTTGPNPWDMMELADILSEYYQKYESGKIKGIFDNAEKALDKHCSKLTSMQMVINYKQLQSLLLKYKLNDSATKVSIKIAEVGKGVHDEMNVFSTNIQITKDDMHAIISPIFEYGTLDAVFRHFAKSFIPNKSREKESFEKTSAKSFTSVIPTPLFDSKGRLRTIVGNIRTDFDGNLLMHVSLSMKLEAIFINAAIAAGISKGIYTTENILSYIKQSPAVKNDRIPILKKGLDAYFEDDYTVAMHLLIPQIEECIRNIAEAASIPTIKQSKAGNGFQARQLDDMLRDPAVIRVMTENLTYYLRILLTDTRGWNLRNEICHGLASPESFNRTSASRLVHVLLCLGAVQPN